MLKLYNIGILIYYCLIYIASFFNKKAALWISGRKNFDVKPLPSSIWFHFASLGEFEQGRPVLEKIKTIYPDQPIVITFFSPSGYSVRKNTSLAAGIYYLPLDTANNASRFIETVNPIMVFFTKYEYWYHYFNELHTKHIPLYIISGIFRPEQVFFKWYGSIHRKMLKMVTWFFIQDAGSKHLLHDVGITNVTINGDTRFDRVWENARHPKKYQLIENFKGNHQLFIAGSTWPQDEVLLAGLIVERPDWKFIIAPHEMSDDKINQLFNTLPKGAAAKYSDLVTRQNAQTIRKVLVIDNIGMLSSLYQYADTAYIGGGFGAGIHNTLEAAAFGLPLIFGPNFEKFKEARDMLDLNAAFQVNNEDELRSTSLRLMDNKSVRLEAGQKAKAYVEQSIGATAAITAYIMHKH